MSWDYGNWIAASVCISVYIFLFTLTILIILLWKNEKVFYGIVAQLLKIERCVIDEHHKIIRRNSTINISIDHTFKSAIDFCNFGRSILESNCKSSGEDQSVEDAVSNDDSASSSNIATSSEDSNIVAKEKSSGDESPIHTEHERVVLNVYGKFLSARKKWNIVFITILTTIIITACMIAAVNALFLSTISVYRDGPCPAIGQMECFCGSNNTRFACDTGKTATFPIDADAGVCFRWTARDITTSDITTQLGITAGLLSALGYIAQGIIQIYLLAFNKRLSIATGIHRIVSKTVGINKHTAPTKICCCFLCCHCSAASLSLYKHPLAVIIVTILYLSVPFLMIPGIILLYFYRFTVTSLTFIVLITFATLCVLSLVWIIVQESESDTNIPGGWQQAKEILANNMGKALNLPEKIINITPRKLRKKKQSF